ncbi:hypothetical protein [Acinetobacter nectaris]|uniref:hypothetical protein n=1 Tax=Acinetobacter nectaris TaxID=1219382 RepID=UPI001F1DB884|nr:hypothetical protein [Acinetobacter nectaris]MCF9035305.1 hypothetical protein [Acinetobacter nectaris]
MIDLEKELNNFEYFCNDFGHVNLAKDKTYRYKNRQTQIMWTHWKARAKLAQAEITELKQKLEKLESGEFVLVPKVPTFAMTESGLMTLKKNESGYYIGSVQHIYKAMIESVEKDHG